MIYSIVLPTQKSSRMNVLFVLRKTRTNSLGECPINCRITVNGTKVPEFSVGINVNPSKWDSKRQAIKGNSQEVTFRNEVIKEVEMKLMGIYRNGIAKNHPYTAQEIKDIYHGKKIMVYKLSQLSSEHVQFKKDEGVVSGTWKRYERCYGYLLDYLKENLQVSEITKNRVIDFWPYLRKKGYTSDYCNKIVQICWGLMEYAKDRDMCDKNPFDGKKLKWKKTHDRTHLKIDELELIKNGVYNERFQKTVDSIIVMSYTGLHIGDYLQFNKEWIIEKNGMQWLDYSRIKTGVQVILPLHSEVKKIINKYGGVENLPKVSAQKNNDYLKIIAEKAGIEKLATNKIARKTFCNLVLNHYRMSLESLAKMIGHTTTRYLKHYVDINETRILDEWPESEKLLA